MVTKDQAKKLATKNNGMEAILVKDGGDKWIVAIKPIGASDDELLMDPYVAVNKKTGKVIGWNPLLNK